MPCLGKPISPGVPLSLSMYSVCVVLAVHRFLMVPLRFFIIVLTSLFYGRIPESPRKMDHKGRNDPQGPGQIPPDLLWVSEFVYALRGLSPRRSLFFSPAQEPTGGTGWDPVSRRLGGSGFPKVGE